MITKTRTCLKWIRQGHPTRRESFRIRRYRPIMFNKYGYKYLIYDRPDKVSVPGTNNVPAGKRQDGINNDLPSSKKIFVSALFFDTQPNKVKAIFQVLGKVKACILLSFPNTGRCKGQALVVYLKLRKVPRKCFK